ncbi:MAG: Isoprenylcysteine carboxyl methyltransferase family [Rhodospirillales bacterium]|nr:Isoprenylcysteine carboxyl methyltransferase family [Rhodospirillales bacterium]
MSAVTIILVLVALQRLGELAYAQRNTRRLLARGALEVGRRHYPLFVLLHGSWLLALFVAVPQDAAIDWPLLGIFVVLQGLRIWVVATLGPYWTTRILTLPSAPLVRRGPFRFVRHPNYLVVIGEIAVLPLVFGAWDIAVVFSLLNLALLTWRIRIEEQALAPRRAGSPG